jgi:hypothetical protein
MALASLFMFGCGTASPVSIQAPDRYEIDDTSLTRIGAKALDESGKPIEDVDVYVSGVSDPTVLKVGHNSELQCQGWGLATVTLEAPPARKDVVVACRLVQELRVAPQKLVTVLEPDATGSPVPRDLGGFQFQAIGMDGKAIKDAPIELAVSAGGVITTSDDGMIRAVQPGRATIHGLIASHTATMEVEVGLLVTTRKAALIEDGSHLGIPVQPGRYKVALGSDVNVRVTARGGACAEHSDGKALEPMCAFKSAGTVRIENPGVMGLGDDAHVTLRLVLVP